MKKKAVRNQKRGLWAVALATVLVIGLLIAGVAMMTVANSEAGTDIVWDFEDGKLEPFQLVSGSYGTIVSGIPQAHNYPYDPYPRQGNYHLSTFESTTYFGPEESRYDDPSAMTKGNEAYQCVIRSPLFRLDSPEMNFLVGGGSEGVYVALCDIYGREIVRATGNNDETMTRIEWNLKYEDILGQYVFIKIVDETAGSWGHITFDDFHAFGYVDETLDVLPEPPNEIHWSFESGALSPFKVVDGSFGVGMIANWVYERNSPYGPINKDGDYFLSTLEGDTQTRPYYENQKGTIVSPTFAIKDPVVNLKLGGGSLEQHPDYSLYVSIVRASDDTELVRYALETLPSYTYNGKTASSGHMLTDVAVTVPEESYVDGEHVYFKIVDNATSNWGFIIVDDIRAKGDIVKSSDPSVSDEYHSVAWDFEDGTSAPFTVNEGSNLNNVMVTDVSYDWNIKANSSVFGYEIGKNGTYWLNTYYHITASNHTVPKQYVTDGVYTKRSGGYGSEPYVGQLRSPNFVLDPENTTITMQLGGNVNNYVAVYDATTGEKLGQANSAKNSWVMTTCSVVWNSDFTYTEGQELYLLIEDTTTSGYGFVCVDNIRFQGRTVTEFQDITWDFEDGTMAPFTPQNGVTLPSAAITDFSYDININAGSNKDAYNRYIGKSGAYWLNTALIAAPVVTVENGICTALQSRPSYNVDFTGALRSPFFTLNPNDTEISMLLGGNPNNGVHVYDYATGEEVGSAYPTNASWLMKPCTIAWKEGFEYDGQILYLEIEDTTTSSVNGGYPLVSVDAIRFTGNLVEFDYADVIWSFENGTYQPFKTDHSFGAGLINTYLQSPSVVPHGKYYLSTVLLAMGSGSYDNNMTGELVSPEFLLNPENPIITLSVVGGGDKSSSYVGVFSLESGELLGKAVGSNSWTVCNRTIDLTGKFQEGERLIMKIVDGVGGSWCWIGVDNIRGSFAFPEASLLTSLSQVMKATGWDEEAYDNLTAIIDANAELYGDEYTAGATLTEELTTLQTKQARLASNGVKEGSNELKAWVEEMEALAYKIRTSTPALGSGLVIFTVHHQYAVDHQNTHNMFPSYNGEISDKAKYTPGGAVKMLNVKTGEVTTLLEDSDGLFRDLDVSYDSDKILLSYRNDRNDTYNIYEYTLNDDRTAVVETKQLTSLSTADDMDPMYLPSGDIVFTSTRDPKYVMCNRQISANIYRMESDGANIVKITSSTLYERPTDVLPDGRILYDRWEYNDRDFASAQGLWTVYEDGTKQDTYYGNNSPTGATIEGKVIPGTTKVMATLSSCHDVSWGALAIIDRSKGVDGSAPVLMTWPASVKDKIGDPNEDKNNIDAYKSLTVKYEDSNPLSEEYFLASRTLPGTTKMGVYLLDIYGNETLLYEDSSSMSCFDATVIQPREEEIDTSDRRNYNDKTGSFFVQDVYEGTHMEGVERGTVKTLRIVESVDKKYISQSQATSWSGEGAQAPGMNWHSFEAKRVIGEVPVYEDGSAYFEVPQDVFVYFQLLDEDGKMIQSMRSGTLVQSGEMTGCVGCHEDRRTAPPTTTGQETPMALKANVEVVPNPDYAEGSNLPKTIAVNTPDVPQKRIFDAETGTDKLVDYNDPEYFEEYTDLPTMNFLTEVQPIFTKNCLTCHGYENPEANLTLVPDRDIIFNAAYINLWVDRNKTGVPFENLVGAVGGGDSRFYTAKTWGSYVSPLVSKVFDDETHSKLLTDAEKRRIAEWVDLNGTYYGDYSTNYGYNQAGRSPLTAAERTALGDNRGYGWSSLQLNTFDRAIYFDNPEKSPILKGLTGAAYDEALAIIQTGLNRLRTNPDVDWKGLTTVPGNTALSINPFKMNKIDTWRTEKVALYDAMEAANRQAIVNGIKKYDRDYEAVMAEQNAKWPGWPTASNPGTYYTQLPD